ERHQDGRVDNELVAVPTDGDGPPVVRAGGRDSYASPRVSPDGRRLAWLEWDHPNLPWDGTELRLATLAGDGLAGDPATVAGGPEESVFQPDWSPDGVLHLVSDRTGWGDLYRGGPGGELEALSPAEEEFGHPQWVFGMATYAFLPGGRIACIHGRGPMQRLGILGPDGALTDLELPFTPFYPPPPLRGAGDRLACIAGSPTGAPAVVLIDPAGGSVEVLRSSEERELDPGYLTTPEPLEFPTVAGRTGPAPPPPSTAPPPAGDAEGPGGARPPLVVASHGGPTSGVISGLRIGFQYF